MISKMTLLALSQNSERDKIYIYIYAQQDDSEFGIYIKINLLQRKNPNRSETGKL